MAAREKERRVLALFPDREPSVSGRTPSLGINASANERDAFGELRETISVGERREDFLVPRHALKSLQTTEDRDANAGVG